MEKYEPKDLLHMDAKTDGIHVEEKEENATPSMMTKTQIIKNLLVLSFAFLFLFTAFQSLQNLQSSLNKEEGLGTVSLAVIYVCAVLAGLVLPPLVITRIGCKWTVCVSMLTYIAFMGANMYAVWGTMIPASMIIGLGSATLWAAKCTYLTKIGEWYAWLTHVPKDASISTFFGVFFMAFQTSQIWGNLISSSIFSLKIPENISVSEDVLSKCGANYCPTDYQNNTNLDRPDMTKVYTVCGIYLGCACVALIIVAVFLDNMVREKEEHKGTKQLMTAIALHFKNSKYQKLLIPLTAYSGVEQAFIAGDYTRSYISCAIGIWNVGYVMIAYGVSDALFSFVIGKLVKYTSFIPWFILVFVVHGGSLIFLLIWTPSGTDVLPFYIIAVCWGIGDAIIQTLINALYGYLFTKKPEAAFASYRLCESAGFILAFGYSSYVCTDIKIYVCIALLTIGSILYGLVEFYHRREIKYELPSAE